MEEIGARPPLGLKIQVRTKLNQTTVSLVAERSLEPDTQCSQDLTGEHAHKGEHSQNHGNGDGYGPNLHAGAAQVGG